MSCFPRNHGKSHQRPADVLPPSLLGTLIDGLSGPSSPSGTLTGTTSEPVSLRAFSVKDTFLQTTAPNGDVNGGGRGR